MSFYEAKSWKERLVQMQAVKDKCNAIINKLALPKDDARREGLIHVRQFCNTLAAVPMQLQKKAEIAKVRPVVMSILGITNVADLKSCLCDLNRNAKTSFVTMVQFALENMIEQVLSSIPGENGFNNFSQSSRRLIKVTGLSNAKDKYELIFVPARMRNSLHAGGIHKKSNISVVIDGKEYLFERNKRVSCASWSHLMHAFYNGLDVYEDMLLSTVVKGVRKIEVA